MIRKFHHINNLSSLKYLSDNTLIIAYKKAKEEKLDYHFIQMLKDELNERNLQTEKKYKGH